LAAAPAATTKLKVRRGEEWRGEEGRGEEWRGNGDTETGISSKTHVSY